MWKKLLVILIVLIILAGAGIGVYFYFKNSDKGNARIEANKEYTIYSMWNALYTTSASGTLVNNPFESGSVINLETNRDAYCKFGEGYKTFEIYFNGLNPLQFIVSYTKVTKSRLTRATIQHIYNGELHSYNVYTDANLIYISAAVTQNVKVASGDEFGTAYRTIQNNEVVMKFYVEVI